MDYKKIHYAKKITIIKNKWLNGFATIQPFFNKTIILILCKNAN